MTAAGHGAAEEGHLSIGGVIALLSPDFPDLTVSKVRFLENEGLVTPERTASGYRRFSVGDRERLRYVLTAQRDRYLPLKVIREELEALDSAIADGSTTALLPRHGADGVPGSTPDDFRSDTVLRLTREDVVAQSEVDPEFVGSLIDAGLIVAGAGGFFDPEAVLVARTAHDLAGHGVDVRHLRGFRTAADRQTGLITQIAGPVARQGDADARDRAAELAREIAALSVALHSTLVTVAVRHALES
ncbi:MerR family transcriptional regulator [Dietzia sp. SYD-A1]|uniref:transcriptional regulator FtsR n=1 Tax=Dietzia sp. SYD-A1 TaxID=2780141 RepID=UPI0018917C51|nr:MerR family transcriptional regulator [Dietzia sp. SYD-A1]